MKPGISRNQQLPLFDMKATTPHDVPFPSTRFQGSKRKLAEWIWESTKHLDFGSVLDVFGGTGAVSHKFKLEGKQVSYNDTLKFNWIIGKALIENSGTQLTSTDVDQVLKKYPDVVYPTFIGDTFSGIFYYDDENTWLDRVVYNIQHGLADPKKQALAFFAMFQACIIKRPYNLFHRANLYMRQADVERSFGNKVTWDTPFEDHFRAFVAQGNDTVFDNGCANLSLNLDALETPTGADLVYLDPPYLNAKGTGVDYREFYHFLEGLTHYDLWPSLIDYRSKHKRLKPSPSPWLNPKQILHAFAQVIARHENSMLVISYRDDGIPTRDELIHLLRQHKQHVNLVAQPQKYALSKRDSHEILLIGT